MVSRRKAARRLCSTAFFAPRLGDANDDGALVVIFVCKDSAYEASL